MPILLVSTIILKRALGVAFISEGHRQTLEIASPWLGDLLFAGVLIAVLGLAHLTYAFVEEPGRRLGRRITDSFILLGARKASRVEVLR
jgi:peptidoglycan/LPS O-acetylase OafA/YrhL